MKAITYTSFGAAREVLKLEQLEAGAPGPGEVMVDLQFSGINPSDVKARAGSRPASRRPTRPTS